MNLQEEGWRAGFSDGLHQAIEAKKIWSASRKPDILLLIKITLEHIKNSKNNSYCENRVDEFFDIYKLEV